MASNRQRQICRKGRQGMVRKERAREWDCVREERRMTFKGFQGLRDRCCFRPRGHVGAVAWGRIPADLLLGVNVMTCVRLRCFLSQQEHFIFQGGRPHKKSLIYMPGIRPSTSSSSCCTYASLPVGPIPVSGVINNRRMEWGKAQFPLCRTPFLLSLHAQHRKHFSATLRVSAGDNGSFWCTTGMFRQRCFVISTMTAPQMFLTMSTLLL